MSIESNKKDFEAALERLKDAAGQLENIIIDELFAPIYDVITEYEHHYSGDIQDMMDKNVELEDLVSNQDS